MASRDELKKKSLAIHAKYRGKLEIVSKVPIDSSDVFSYIYTPGVADVSRAIEKDPEQAYQYTSKWNTVAIVTNGSRLLGLGNTGPLAALAVMEGKAVLFKHYGNVDAFPICLDTQ
ncbi:MAG: NADP-dependent malic enzyme, partial [Candidatus Aenigmarchaeota archaeon]|nr:NADP-dependent malic enzyme [Candidatus Aenigmarchaeota archaeon]